MNEWNDSLRVDYLWSNVNDVGAPLSHAAIVARELGILAVVGYCNATTVLQDGERIRVDGGRGIVERVDGSS